MKHIISRLNRFNWLIFREWNLFAPQNKGDWAEADDLAHAHNSRCYRAEWESRKNDDDNNAIFQFMGSTRKAYRESWVQDQIEAWNKDGTEQSSKKIQDLAKAYTLMKGYRKVSEVIANIEKDIETLEFILNEDPGKKLHADILDRAAKKRGLSYPQFRKIWDFYRKEMERTQKVCDEGKAKDVIVNTGQGPLSVFFKYYPNYDFSREAFVLFLRDTLDNLKKYVD